MSALSFEETSQFIAAAIIALIFLGVALGNVFNTGELLDQTNAKIDSRRVAQVLEIVDHRGNVSVRVGFPVSYESISLGGENLRMEKGSQSSEVPLYLESDVEDSDLSGDFVCVERWKGTLSLTKDCDIGGEG